MRNFDFSSWQAILTSIAGLLLVTLIGMGIRLVMMLTLQQRRERQNRQINERLKALIAAYKVLGGSFTGTLTVNPAHLRDLRRVPLRQAQGEARRQPQDLRQAPDPALAAGAEPLRPQNPDAPGEAQTLGPETPTIPPQAEDAVFAGEAAGPQSSERARRMRDAVEAALSDVVLFGTEPQVELAAAAMRDMVAGKPVEVHALVVSLRTYIRAVLDLDPIPPSVVIPNQGPTRPSPSGGRGGRGESGRAEGGGRGGGSGDGMGGGMAMGGGMGLGVGLGAGATAEEDEERERG